MSQGERRRHRVTALLRMEPGPDSGSMTLAFRDEAGSAVSLVVPAALLAAIVAGLPRVELPDDGAAPLRVASWSLDGAPDGADLVLTIVTETGEAGRVRLTGGQVAGMATLTRFGGLTATGARTRH